MLVHILAQNIYGIKNFRNCIQLMVHFYEKQKRAHQAKCTNHQVIT